MSNRLDLDRDREAHAREWRVQRIGWCFWAAALIAAVLGLTGGGPLSARVATSADGRLTTAYDRFVRHHCSTDLELSIRRDIAADRFRVFLSQEFFDAVTIERIEPQPSEQLPESGGVLLLFPAANAVEEARIVIHFQPEMLGNVEWRLGTGDASQLTISQFVYP